MLATCYRVVILPTILLLVTCNLVVGTPRECSLRVLGSKGDLIIPGPCARPESYTIRIKDGEETTKHFPIEGYGLHWEADEVARCIRDGLKECKRMPHAESILAMEVGNELYGHVRETQPIGIN